MVQHLRDANTILRVENEHLCDKVLHIIAYCVYREFKVSLEDQLVQVSDVVCLERHCPLDHCVQEDSQTPYIGTEALISLIVNNLRGQISRRSTLLIDCITFFDDSTYSEVTQLDATFAIHQHIIQLDVTMQHAATMAVTKGVKDLLEDCLRTLFIQPSSFLHVLE